MRLLSTPPRVGDTVLWRYRRGATEATVARRVVDPMWVDAVLVVLPGNGLRIRVADWRTLGEPEVAA